MSPITPIPVGSHWNAADYFDADPKRPDFTYAQRGGFLSPVYFNPMEFGMAPKDIEAQRDREILDEWHKHPGLGPSQIRNQLRRHKITVSVHTVRRVMEDAGYRPPKVKREP